MNILAFKTDERVEAVYFTRNSLVVDLVDGRTISVPLVWYPKLLNASIKRGLTGKYVVEVMVSIGLQSMKI